MQYVVTLIGPTGDDGLDGETLEDVCDALTGEGAKVGDPQWLSEGHACDINFRNIEPYSARDILLEQLAGTKIDLAVVPVENRKKRLLIADMDSTIIQVECIDELADVMGLRDKVSEITERAMRGDLDFAEALRERAAMLKGLEESALQDVYESRVKLTPGARTLVHTMNDHGAVTVLVSGGFTFFSSRVAEAAGFTVQRANRLVIEDGKLTGAVHEPVMTSQGKLETLVEVARENTIDLLDTLAIGDGANDIPMIETAGLGAAYHAKPKTRSAADLTIDFGDLTALLYVQGYSDDDITHI